MLRDLMHNMLGTGISSAAQNAAFGGAIGGAVGNQITASQYNKVMPKDKSSKNVKLFHGTVEVLQVANGYIVNIGRKEGYEYETYIADTITDVNERIAAAIVAFQLEK